VSMWRRTLVYLGLVEEPDEHEDYAEPVPAHVDHDGAEPSHDPLPAAQLQQPTNVRRLAPVTEPGGAHVRPMAAGLGARVQVVAVVTFDDGAAEIARQYRMGAPVLFDMADADPATARRVLDFVSGVTFALRGRMSKVGGRAFLVVPEGVELSSSERERLASLGYRGGA
jgi:cell division inhibitor SepF